MMIKKTILPSFLLVLLIACNTGKQIVRLPDLYQKYYWTSFDSTTEVTYELNFNVLKEQIWLTGTLNARIADFGNEYYINGFQKGDEFVAFFKQNLRDSAAQGPVFFRCSGAQSDSLIMENSSEETKFLPRRLVLYRKGK
jgi:hypothetical protein